ncbi:MULTISPECIES: DUF2806 domain-containing protein [Roseomonadaceae]|uniref:DUF2806 domain-containing protein n=1 Tax=Falsiroseomonas oleicola TaxID=2801474 RepID=A0ABS6HEC1_9PROT|nr:DUF2806 domain-containing protein [Roseomonas oleicola]MBU8547097.1 DUF2806 domain-containing protein [Roseomonas oleicola]
MSADEPPVAAVTESGSAFAKVAEGGLLRLLVSKPVQEAIGRLVSSAVDVPALVLEKRNQRNRDEIAAQSRITRALSEVAAKRISKDSELVQRAIDRWVGDLANKQQAREDVARRTLEHLADNPPPAYQAEGPSIDFMGYFANVAESVTSDSLRDLLARLLVGEIRNPGTISRQAVQIASLMDQKAVQALWSIKPWLIGSTPAWLPSVGPFAESDGIKKIHLLDAISVLRVSEAAGVKFVNEGKALLQCQVGGILLHSKNGQEKFPLIVGGAHLTPAGEEIASLIPSQDSVSLEDIGRGFSQLRGLDKVEICEVVKVDNLLYPVNVRSLA